MWMSLTCAAMLQEQRERAAELAQQDSLPWRGLDDICVSLRQARYKYMLACMDTLAEHIIDLRLPGASVSGQPSACSMLSSSNAPRGSRLPWPRREQGGNGGDEGPWLHRLCSGSELALPPPPERVRSAALQERLAKLEKDLEAKTYAAMVHDVTGEARPVTACSGRDSRIGHHGA